MKDEVWQKAHSLTLEIFKTSAAYPRGRRQVLAAQTQLDSFEYFRRVRANPARVRAFPTDRVRIGE
jgi:hypothetical protein